MSSFVYNLPLLREVSGRMDLRQPNEDALVTMAYHLQRHVDAGHETDFRGVVDVATGVGKTYVIAAAIDYFAELGFTNFAVIVHRGAILRKTAAQFTPGHQKSLTGGMAHVPRVVTIDGFAQAASLLDDETEVKLHLFTVQSLVRPNTREGRRTHNFDELLGGPFYDHLAGLDDLIVFADEHHALLGPAFASTVSQLRPVAMFGLTATPDAADKTPVIFRYPLAAALADRLVKHPMIVGRTDDLSDERTQLVDGARLLQAREQRIAAYCEATGDQPVNPIMLVICRDIRHAEETRAFLTSGQYESGAYRDAVLTVHSGRPEEALEALAGVESLSSPVRIIVAVDMLKEGWDVKNVYVIASLRPSVSDVLTEQTLGRGLRLPFGRQVGDELLDTVEVLAHERYERLLARKDTLVEDFIDMRTIVEHIPAKDGSKPTLRISQAPVQPAIFTPSLPPPSSSAGASAGGAGAGLPQQGDSSLLSGFPIVDSARYVSAAEYEGKAGRVLKPSPNASQLVLPAIRTRPLAKADVLLKVPQGPFVDLGQQLAALPEAQLRRERIDAEVVQSRDGRRRIHILRRRAEEEIVSPALVRDAETARRELVALIMDTARDVPSTRSALGMLELFVEGFVKGAGARADDLISQHRVTVASSMMRILTREIRQLRATEVGTVTDVRFEPFEPVRMSRGRVEPDRHGKFDRSVAYSGWAKSHFPEATFASGPERTFANLLDGDPLIVEWLRLADKELEIPWGPQRRNYNPDFLAYATDGTTWVLEVKSDKDAYHDDVVEKRAAAIQWCRAVTTNSRADWRYLLVTETMLRTAKDSWRQLAVQVEQ